MRFLILQAIFVPVVYYVAVLTAGYIAPNYNQISQHASELTIPVDKTNSNLSETELERQETARLVTNAGAIAAGVSIMVLGFGLVCVNGYTNCLSAILFGIFGFSMVTNGIFPMGSPMHGCYGIGLSYCLLPFLLCYELKGKTPQNSFFPISLLCGFVIFYYFWSMLVGFDPAAYRGLTQRLFGIFIFGWVAIAAWVVGMNPLQKT